MELSPRVQSKPAVDGQNKVFAYDAAGVIKSGFPIDTSIKFTQGYISRGEWMDSSKSTNFNAFKDCSHYKVGCDIFNGIERRAYFLDTSDGDWGYYVFKNALGDQWPSQLGELDAPLGLSSYAIPALFYGSPGFRRVALPRDFRYLQEKALRLMLPQIRPKLSLLNAVYELKDFKRVFERTAHLTTAPSVRELLRRAKALYSPRRGDRRTVRRYLRASADGYLQAQFNILPLLKDIAGLAAAIQNVRKQIQNLLDRVRTPQVRHYECPLDPTQYYDRVDNVFEEPIEFAPATLDGSTIYTRSVTYNRAVFNATVRYSYTLTGWERSNALLGGFLDSVGVNLNPAILWNAIRWTFVIDWLLGVSNFIDQFKVRWLEPVCTIDDYCSSVTVDRQIECFQEFNHGGTRQMGGQVVASRIHETAYCRDVTMPSLYSAIRASGLSSTEFSLSAALLASR